MRVRFTISRDPRTIPRGVISFVTASVAPCAPWGGVDPRETLGKRRRGKSNYLRLASRTRAVSPTLTVGAPLSALGFAADAEANILGNGLLLYRGFIFWERFSPQRCPGMYTSVATMLIESAPPLSILGTCLVVTAMGRQRAPLDGATASMIRCNWAQRNATIASMTWHDDHEHDVMRLPQSHLNARAASTTRPDEHEDDTRSICASMGIDPRQEMSIALVLL